MPVAEVNEAVLQTVELHALTPEAIEQVIHLTERDEVRDRKIAHERKDLEKRIANITAAIEADGLGSLLQRLRELEERRTAIDEQLRNLSPIPRLAPEIIREPAGRVAAAAAVVHHAGPQRAPAHPDREADVYSTAQRGQ